MAPSFLMVKDLGVRVMAMDDLLYLMALSMRIPKSS